MIAIGDYLFKINLTNEIVLALARSHADELANLKNENTNDKNIMVFSTDDDVLDLLEEGVTGTVNGHVELFCGQSGADGKKDEGFDTYLNDDLRQDKLYRIFLWFRVLQQIL